MTNSVLTAESVGEQHLSAEPIDNNEYFSRFTEMVASAGKDDRISMSTLCFDPREDVVNTLAEELLGARERKAKVQLAIDHFGFPLAHQFGMIAAGRLIDPEGLAARREVVQALRRAGADVTITNQDTLPFSFLFRFLGRNHIKVSVFNDELLAGGPNQFDANRSDIVVALHHPDAANMAHNIVSSMVKTGTTQAAFQGKDRRLKLPHGELLLDAGVPGRSVIMDEMLMLVDNAEKSITSTTQYAPHGAFIRHTRAAEKRGVKLNMPCSISDVEMERRVFGLMRTVHGFIYSADAAGYCIPESLPELHANLLLIDAGIVGKQVAVAGSHVHSSIGVRGGNAELSYRTDEPAFIAKAGEIVLKQTTLAST